VASFIEIPTVSKEGVTRNRC